MALLKFRLKIQLNALQKVVKIFILLLLFHLILTMTTNPATFLHIYFSIVFYVGIY